VKNERCTKCPTIQHHRSSAANAPHHSSTLPSFLQLADVRIRIFTVQAADFCRCSRPSVLSVRVDNMLSAMSRDGLDISSKYALQRSWGKILIAAGFNTWYKVAQSLSAVGVAICVFLLLSWTVLPVERTKRHYLAICLVVGIFFEAVSLCARPSAVLIRIDGVCHTIGLPPCPVPQQHYAQ
jgi:hypothetical protein